MDEERRGEILELFDGLDSDGQRAALEAARKIKNGEVVNEMLTLQLRRLRSYLYVTMVLCALLVIGLITYIVIDARIPYAGFIRATRLSGGAWLFILLVIAAAVVMGGLLLRLSTKYTEENTERGKT